MSWERFEEWLYRGFMTAAALMLIACMVKLGVLILLGGGR